MCNCVIAVIIMYNVIHPPSLFGYNLFRTTVSSDFFLLLLDVLVMCTLHTLVTVTICVVVVLLNKAVSRIRTYTRNYLHGTIAVGWMRSLLQSKLSLQRYKELLPTCSSYVHLQAILVFEYKTCGIAAGAYVRACSSEQFFCTVLSQGTVPMTRFGMHLDSIGYTYMVVYNDIHTVSIAAGYHIGLLSDVKQIKDNQLDSWQ